MVNETEEMIPGLQLEINVDRKYDLAAMVGDAMSINHGSNGFINDVPLPVKVEKFDPDEVPTTSRHHRGGFDPMILSRIKIEPAEVDESNTEGNNDFDSPCSPPPVNEPTAPPLIVTTEAGNRTRIKREPVIHGIPVKEIGVPGTFHCHSCEKRFPCHIAWGNHIKLYRNFKGCFPSINIGSEIVINNNQEGLKSKESNSSEDAQAKLYYCCYCTVKTKYKHDLLQHIWAHHKKQDLGCALCPKKFTTVRYLKKHLNYMHNPNPMIHKCTFPKCKYRTKDKNSLKIHNRIHNDKFHCCGFCSFKTKHPIKLKKHTDRKHKIVEKNYKCDHCSYAGAELKYLVRHCETIHYKGPSDLFCSECSFKTFRKSYMISHIRRMHQKKEAKLSCSLCNYRTRDKGGLNMHTLRKHSNISVNRCLKCDFMTYKKDLFYSHLNKHLQLPIFKCPECSFKGSTADGFKDHIFRKHCKIWFYCHHCGHKASTKYLISNHINFKHNPNAAVFQCSQCAYKSKTQDLLSRHFNIKHNPDAVVYHCFHCSYTTKIKPKLGQHMQKKHNFLNKRKKQKLITRT